MATSYHLYRTISFAKSIVVYLTNYWNLSILMVEGYPFYQLNNIIELSNTCVHLLPISATKLQYCDQTKSEGVR